MVAVAFVVSSCTQPRPAHVESRYTSAMFVRALANSSTAPDFVLITVVDARDESTRTVCTVAPFLKGALHIELGIPYDEDGRRQVRELALKQSDRVFRFSKPDALRNVQPGYTSRQLDSVRVLIAERPDSDLLDKRFVKTLYMRRGGSRNAVAHALLERGINCVRGCVVGDLTPYK